MYIDYIVSCCSPTVQTRGLESDLSQSWKTNKRFSWLMYTYALAIIKAL